MLTHKCKICLIGKEYSEFHKEPRVKLGITSVCKVCHKGRNASWYRENENKVKEYRKIYYEENKEKVIQKNKEYHQENKEYFKEHYKKYRLENKDKIAENDKIKIQRKKYYENNKEKISQERKEQRANDPIFKEKARIRGRAYKKRRLQNDVHFRLRESISNSISKAIKNNQGVKEGSILKYLSFSVSELKTHIELQFEPWMNWENRGMYIPKAWDDKNEKTWTWQLDHIIPHADLPYDSLEHENFKKCWSLDNLRPLSAKQNLFDGLTKVRHNKVKK